MFGPKHTLESVAKELADGLEEGTIALHPEEPTEADVENFESMAIKSLAQIQRKVIAQLIVGTLCLGMGIAILFGGDESSQSLGAHSTVVAIIGSIIGSVAGFALGHRSRERSVELKTFIRILKMADASTAKRLVLWEGPRLRRKALVP